MVQYDYSIFIDFVTSSFSNLGFTYKHFKNEWKIKRAELFLAGLLHFRLAEIEVYHLE